MVDDACVKKMADVHFTWQAWGSGCMSAFGKVLEGGSAQVWGSCILTLLSVRIAWQAWGIVDAACVSRARRGEGCDLARRRAWQAPGIVRGS